MELQERIKAYYINKTLKIQGNEEIHLGSSSPRRIEMISRIKTPVQISSPVLDEERVLSELSEQINEKDIYFKNSVITALLAKEKAKVIKPRSNEILLTADTTVLLDKKILGKPVDQEDALSMLLSLSDKIHFVTTGVCLYIDEKHYDNFFLSTAVKFRKIEGPLLLLAEKYVREGKAQDKAGAYGIQEEAGLFIEWIYGDYDTIVGLPLSEIYKELGELFK